MYGFVYVLRNEAMPSLYKIGHTMKSPNQRAIELSAKTNIPQNFEVVYYGELNNPEIFEKELHEKYSTFRVNASREFFNLSDDDLFWLCNYIKEISDNVSECEFFEYLEFKIIHGKVI